MTIAALATIIFFLSIGVYQFVPANWLRIVVGVSAILLGVLAIIGLGAVHV